MMSKSVDPRLNTAINSKDVARLAKVSQSTVSLIFSGKAQGRVSEATRQRVLAVAESLGYQPNVSAQILRKGSPKSIAFVVPDLQQPFFGRLLYAAELAAAKLGYSIILLDSLANHQWCDKLITLMQSKMISGSIIYACESAFAQKLAAFKQQVVYLEPDDESLQNIGLELDAVIEQIFAYIKESARYRIGFFRANLPRSHFIRRHKTFEKSFNLLSHKEKVYFAEYSSFAVEEATLHAESLLSNKPNLVICDDDFLAGGIYRAAKKLGIAIPEDMAVISFNNTDLCRYLYPELSAVAIPAEQIGQLAVKMLIERGQGISAENQQQLVKLSYISRGSTR